jgi:zinc protease
VKPLNARLTAAGLVGLLGVCAGQAAAQATPPAPLPERPMQFPAFHEATLPNGLRLVVVENHARPVASADLYVRGGSSADPAGKQGLASMTAGLLNKGTPTRNAQQIAERIEGVGGSLSASAGDDWIDVSADVLSDQLPLALDLMSDVALHPAFAANELETSRTQRLSTLQSSLGEPGTVAARAFARQVYGTHPYGSASVPATVRAITRDDLVRYHGTYFRPGNALLVISGDVTQAQAMSMARQYFGSWTGGAAPRTAMPAPPQLARTQIYLVHRPGSVQSNIVAGNLALRPENPDYYAVAVMSQILGGGSSGRLFQILRQQHGWTYGSYSNVSRPRDVGAFQATAEVRTEVTDSALAEMMRQVRRMRDEPVPAAELASVKSFMVGSYPLRFETPDQIASRLATDRLLGLPADAMRTYREHIAAVTAADVQRVAQKYLQPDHMAVVVVGDAGRVLSKLEPIAPVVLLDVEGRPLDRSAVEVRASTDRFDGSRLAPATFTYQVMVQGNALGTATATITQDGAAWRATSQLGIAMAGLSQADTVWFGNDLVASAYKLLQTQGPNQISADLRLANGRITGATKLPAAAGGDRTVDLAAIPGTRLPGMDALILAVADLADGKTITYPAYGVRANGVSNVTVKVVGSESVTTPAGTFDTWKMEMSGGDAPATLYVRKSLPHVLVKREVTGQPISIVLQSMQ